MIKFVENTKNTFSCVDARNNFLVFGTPGGDFAEFAAALQVYVNMTGMEPTDENIKPLFVRFLKDHCSFARPFYYHTDESKLNKLFIDLEKRLGRRPSIFPWDEPENNTDINIWMEEFVKPEHQGCGHVRLLLGMPHAYGFPDNRLVQSLLRVLVRHWWSLPDEQKGIIDFATKLGYLTGKAVAIINTNSTSEKCMKSSPMVIPNVRGSTSFIYHKTAITDFRRVVLAPFFAARNKKKIKSAQVFFEKLNLLAESHLGVTLGPNGLQPANQVDIFEVNVGYVPQPSKPKTLNGFQIGVIILSVTMVVLLIIVAIVFVFRLGVVKNMIWCFVDAPQKASSGMINNPAMTRSLLN